MLKPDGEHMSQQFVLRDAESVFGLHVQSLVLPCALLQDRIKDACMRYAKMETMLGEVTV